MLVFISLFITLSITAFLSVLSVYLTSECVSEESVSEWGDVWVWGECGREWVWEGGCVCGSVRVSECGSEWQMEWVREWVTDGVWEWVTDGVWEGVSVGVSECFFPRLPVA